MKIQKAVTALALTLFVATAPAALAKNDKQKGKKHGKQRTESGARHDDARYNQAFAQFDVNGDGVISRNEFPSDGASFDRFDTNRDGQLTRSEIEQRLRSRNDAENELRQLDRNRDGQISRDEWRGDFGTFDRLDRNRDGVLSRADRGQHDASTSREEGRRFYGLDRNRDGVVTRDEWRGNDTSFRQHDRNRDGVLSGTELQ